MPRLVADPVGAELAGQVATAHSPRVLSEVLVPSHGAVSFQRISEVLPYQLESYTRRKDVFELPKGMSLRMAATWASLECLSRSPRCLLKAVRGGLQRGRGEDGNV